MLVSSWLLLEQADPAESSSPPYPPSQVIKGITWDFSGLIRLAPGSDLWPTTWAADGNVYASWGDGGGFGGTNDSGRVSLGFARIEGSPTSLTGRNVWGGYQAEHPATFEGKSAGMLSVDGTLYAWINTQNSSTPDIRLAWSSDLGATWQLSTWKFASSTFAPSVFLNFGKDNAGARDGYVYTYGGRWLTPSPVYLVRVPKAQIKSQSAYEYFAGLGAGRNPTWTPNVQQAKPVFADSSSTDANGANHASVIYNPGIGRYILTAPHGGAEQLGIFDAPEPWGPWTTVAYYDNWGTFTGEGLLYFFPTKWISANGKTMWMVFSSTAVLDSFNLIKATLNVDGSVTSPPSPDLPYSVYLSPIYK